MDEVPTPGSTPAQPPQKPAKPWPDFPLFWHATGRWAVKRHGRHFYYTADAIESYDQFKRDEDARASGAALPSQVNRSHTLKDAVNVFFTRQLERHRDGEISDRQIARYRKELQVELPMLIGKHTRLVELAGPEAPALFAAVKSKALKRGLESCRVVVNMLRAVLDMANRRGMMPPANYQDSFDPPSKMQYRKQNAEHIAEHGDRAWTIEQLRQIVQAAKDRNPHIYAQVLLGLFGSFGAEDCCELTDAHIDREKSIIKMHRPKTMILRLTPLLPEMLEAIDASRKQRPEPASEEYANRIFLARTGLPVVRIVTKSDDKGITDYTRLDNVGMTFDRIIEPMGLKRRKTGFYTLRAMFASLAKGAGVDADLLAIIMGQAFNRPVMEFYLRADLREKLFDITRHVWQQVFPKESPRSRAAGRGGAGGPSSRRGKPRAE